MPCLLVGCAAFFPRTVLFFIWLLTDWFGRSFDTWVWPLIGFFIMPYSTLAYMAAMLNNDKQLNGLWLVLFIVTVIMDVGTWGSAKRHVGRDRP
jgi:hypothetical protein